MKKHTFDDLVAIMAKLRSPDGCPWDREQTPTSILPHLIEEAYETFEAIESGNKKEIVEELGDLLLQVVFHSQFLTESGDATINDIINVLCEKLIRRHPHVFGDTPTTSTDDVLRNWEAIKAQEKKSSRASMLSGIPKSLPGLLRAFRFGEKTARVGFDWPTPDGVIDKVAEEVQELREALSHQDKQAVSDEFGDLLFTLANAGRKLGLDPETAIRQSCQRFEKRFSKMETFIRDEKKEISAISAEEWDQYWEKAKHSS